MKLDGSSKVMAAMPLRISAMLLRVLAAMPLQFGHISISKNIAAMSLHSGGDAAAKLEIMLQKFIFQKCLKITVLVRIEKCYVFQWSDFSKKTLT